MKGVSTRAHFGVCDFVRNVVWGQLQNAVTFLLATVTVTSQIFVPCQSTAALQEAQSLDQNGAAESTSLRGQVLTSYPPFPPLLPVQRGRRDSSILPSPQRHGGIKD